MTSLPERLRSLAIRREWGSAPEDTRALIREAADELDRRAERILRLEYWLRKVDPVTLRALESLDPEQPPSGVTLTEDPGEIVIAPGHWVVTAHPDGTLTLRRG